MVFYSFKTATIFFVAVFVLSFFAPHAVLASPLVTTNPASSVGNTEATLHGAVNANGAYTNVWFEYGISSSLGTTVGLQSVGNYSGTTNFSFHIFPLQSNTTYYFRAVAQNTNGTVNGSIVSFTTGPGSAPQTPPVLTTTPSPSSVMTSLSSGGSPFVTTRGASGISQTIALLNGSVHPNGELTNVWFEWGETVSLGNSTLKQPLGNGTRFLDYSAVLSGLRPATTYFYRSIAENRFGKREGQIFNFLTTGVGVPVISVSPPAPSLAPAGPRRVVVEETQVSMEVSPDTNEPSRGEEFNITITYRNKSDALLENVLLTVNIPPDVLFLNSTVSLKNEPGQALLFNLGRLGPGGEGAVNIRLKVKESAAVDSVLIFSVALEYSDPSGEDRKIDTFVVLRVKDGGEGFATTAFSDFPWWIFLLILPALVLVFIFLKFAKKKRHEGKMEDIRPLPIKKL